MGVGDTFVPTPVGVFFGADGEKTPGKTVAGPVLRRRRPRPHRLHRVRRVHDRLPARRQEHPAEELPRASRNRLAPRSSDDHGDRSAASVRRRCGTCHTARTGAQAAQKPQDVHGAATSILAAGTWGTQQLLFKMRDTGALPKLSDKLGVLTRTNSESIVGAGQVQGRPDDSTSPTAWRSRRRSTRRATPTSSRCRYGKGSNAMGLLQTLMTDGGGPQGTDVPRWKQLFRNAEADPSGMLRMLNAAALERAHHDRAGHAEPGQLDHHVHQEGPVRLPQAVTSKQGHGEPNPTWIPAGNEVTRRIAEKIDGVAGGTWGELFNIPLTAHFLGGCRDRRRTASTASSTRTSGCTATRRCSVVDGAAVSANLGREPVAVDHRAGRAGGVAVAEQGRGGSAAGAGRALPAARPDRARRSGRARRSARRAGAADRRDPNSSGARPPKHGVA